MNPLQTHLLLNHIPIVGLFFCLLFLAYAIFTNSEKTLKASYMGLILVALLTIPVFLSGEPAEELVEDYYPAVDHDVIHEHEEEGERAFVFMNILGFLAIAGLYFTSQKKFPVIKWVVAVLAFVVFIMMMDVGKHGGAIMRPEMEKIMQGDE